MDPLAEARQLFLDALALQEKGDLEQAEGLYKKALALAPERPSIMNNLAAVLFQSKKYVEARLLCERRLETNPEDAVALLNLGNCQDKLNSPQEALASYEKALKLKPDYASALINRGSVLLEQKRPQEAMASCERALAIEPNHAEALNNRGNALCELGRTEEALASYDRALLLNPAYADALSNRGNALRGLKRMEEALASYDRALAIKPDHAKASSSRGNALLELKRLQEALASYDRALATEPDYANALSARGEVLRLLERHGEAIESYRRLLVVKPGYDYASGCLLHTQLHSCDWGEYDEGVARIVEGVKTGKRADVPFQFLVISDSPAEQLKCARIFAADQYPAAAQPMWRGERYDHDRIRVAYLSADLREHVMAYCLLQLFEAHNQARFETTAISFGLDTPSEMRSRLKGAFSRFVDVRRKSDREVAQLLRDLEIDIAIDLNGFTTDCRAMIFAHRPAPVQVNYLGYPGTMGVDFIDYILADRFVIPEQHRSHYAEQIAYLPDAYMTSDSRRVITDRTPTRLEAGLPGQGFVFCSFSNSYKLNPAVFDSWMRLLGRVKGSVLWLRETGEEALRNLRSEAARRGVAPERLVFAPRTEKIEDHLARHRLADLSLDTLPYNAHSTTSDALWAGLPVVTCMGTTFAGRVGASLLSAIGLNELITHSLEEYEALILELATNPKHLADIRSKLTANRATHPLFDTDRFRRHIEAAYTTMWERYQRGEPPASFAVDK